MADKAHQFDQLISAIAGAVIDAQYITKQSQLNDLKNFFYERDPKEIEAEAQKALEEAEVATKELGMAKEKGMEVEAERLKAEAMRLEAKAERLKAEAEIKHYSPKTVYISFQSVRPSAKPGEMDTVPVPLITLVKPVQHSIEEMMVSMNVELGEVRESGRKENERKRVSERKDDWSMSEGKNTISVSTTPGKQSGEVGTAQVTLKIKAEEPQEGLARLIDNLYKVL